MSCFTALSSDDAMRTAPAWGSCRKDILSALAGLDQLLKKTEPNIYRNSVTVDVSFLLTEQIR